jgi:hypothetical protein
MSKYLGSAGKSCSTHSCNKVGTCHIKFYRFSRTRNKQGIVWFIENMKKNFAYVKGTLRCEQSLGYTYCNSSTPFQSEETKHINWALQILKTWGENITKLLFGYDTSGGTWGVCAALGLSNGINNLSGTLLEVIYFVYTLVPLCSLTMTVDNLMLLYLYYKIKVSESYIIIFWTEPCRLWFQRPAQMLMWTFLHIEGKNDSMKNHNINWNWTRKIESHKC